VASRFLLEHNPTQLTLKTTKTQLTQLCEFNVGFVGFYVVYVGGLYIDFCRLYWETPLNAT
jgi:hypothetical protein